MSCGFTYSLVIGSFQDFNKLVGYICWKACGLSEAEGGAGQGGCWGRGCARGCCSFPGWHLEVCAPLCSGSWLGSRAQERVVCPSTEGLGGAAGSGSVMSVGAGGVVAGQDPGTNLWGLSSLDPNPGWLTCCVTLARDGHPQSCFLPMELPEGGRS